MATQDVQQQLDPDQPLGRIPWFLKAKCPVFLPKNDALTLPKLEFEAFLRDSIRTVPVDQTIPDAPEPAEQDTADNPLLELFCYSDDGLSNTNLPFRYYYDDRFYADGSDRDGRLPGLLVKAWAQDPDSTLKTIFNMRSICMGLKSRMLFYRCAGWLATSHPLTLLANLRWLVRPVAINPFPVPRTTDEDAEVLETSAKLSKLEIQDSKLTVASDMTQHDVENGVSHGYWKDLLNILALSANGRLDIAASQADILHVERQSTGTEQWPDKERAREIRHGKRRTRHETVVDLYTNDPLHRAIHLTVARLFAEQLQSDLAALAGDDERAKRKISLCGKWAPSTDRFHDRHTFVTSSIAEIMFPESQFVEQGVLSPSTTDDERTIYLRHARESYRKAVSALRKHLEVVERDVTANTPENVNYERVPALAMQRYAYNFYSKDLRFEDYLLTVAGRMASAPVLLPSILIRKAFQSGTGASCKIRRPRHNRVRRLAHSLIPQAETATLVGEWNTLVRRVKDSGTMASCIAVCDASRSMDDIVIDLADDMAAPLHTSIGLALLFAEVAEPPFHGKYITFSERPVMQTVDMSASLRDKSHAIKNSFASFGLTADFEAVLTALILPMAVHNQLEKDKMIKRVVVLTNKNFDQARHGADAWSTTYERIQKAYQVAGYEVPELVFWNLAAVQRNTVANTWDEDGTVNPGPQPVAAEHIGVTIVNGCSQAKLQLFVDTGTFAEEKAEMVETVVDEDELEQQRAKRRKLRDPMAHARARLSMASLAMLKVVD